MPVNKRCPNGSRRNKKTGNCDKKSTNKSSSSKKSYTKKPSSPKRKRCPVGSRRNKKTGNCDKKSSPKKKSPKKKSPKKKSPKKKSSENSQKKLCKEYLGVLKSHNIKDGPTMARWVKGKDRQSPVYKSVMKAYKYVLQDNNCL
jgi:hypothetical protein